MKHDSIPASVCTNFVFKTKCLIELAAQLKSENILILDVCMRTKYESNEFYPNAANSAQVSKELKGPVPGNWLPVFLSSQTRKTQSVLLKTVCLLQSKKYFFFYNHMFT